jgi:hypothetical protein
VPAGFARIFGLCQIAFRLSEPIVRPVHAPSIACALQKPLTRIQ